MTVLRKNQDILAIVKNAIMNHAKIALTALAAKIMAAVDIVTKMDVTTHATVTHVIMRLVQIAQTVPVVAKTHAKTARAAVTMANAVNAATMSSVIMKTAITPTKQKLKIY